MMNDVLLIVVPILMACVVGGVFAYQIYQMFDFLIGITIFTIIAVVVLYQFLAPTSMLHRAVPNLPAFYWR